MLNYIWLGMVLLAVAIGGLTGKMGAVNDSVVANVTLAVQNVAKLLGMMIVWLGMMRLASKAGLVQRLGLALKPLLRFLFPQVPAGHPAMGSMVMNMSANILGLDNAATPLGLRAMKELDQLNPKPGIATNAMCMLLAINTSSITLIPMTMITYLATAHGTNPSRIIGTALLATLATHIVAIATAKFLENKPFFRAREFPVTVEADGPAGVVETRQPVPEEVLEEPLPWVPYARPILWLTGLVFLATVWLAAFPESVGWPPNDPDPAHGPLMRLLDGFCLVAVPWMICFFPLYAALRRVPVYEEFVEGGKEGFQTCLRILPYVVAMLLGVGMLRAAGVIDHITAFFAPIANRVGFPPELIPMALIRPFSSSAALAIFLDLLHQYGPDNLLTLTAATIYGCSETTFYVLAVYFGSVNIKQTRHAIPAGLVADFVGPIAAVIVCRCLLGG